LIKDFVEIVRDDCIAGPLGIETEGNENQETPSIAFSLEELEDTIVGKLLLESEGCFNFLVDELDGYIIFIVKCKIVSKNLESLVGSVLLDIPTWGFSGN